MSRGRVVIISGPSGSGKTTLHQKLLLSRLFKGKLVKSISATTRPKRLGEKNGRDYLFISRKDFLAKRRAGYFLEWQKVFENYYGTPQKNVNALLERGKHVLLCIDVKGAKVVRRKCPDAVTVFIKAPSWPALKKRLKSRNSENRNELQLRLRIAKQEMQEAEKYKYVVVNDVLSLALKKLKSIIAEEIRKEK